MQNVGKCTSHKEKKRILSLDNVHESIDSGSVERGGKEKETSLDRQILWRKKTVKKNFPLPATTDLQANFYR